jgi:hypothetical protein
MPVKKFRTFADAERASWFEPGDPRIIEAARRRWSIHRALGKPRVPSRTGVSKYRSVEEKQRDTKD